MTDYRKLMTCPECGAALQFASGCYFCPSCGHGKCHRSDLLATVLSFVFMVGMISLMVWATVPEEREHGVPFVDKAELVRLQPAAMAEATARFNAEMERRAKGE